MNIPKIAFRIWFGPFPQKYQDYLKSLAELNPDYTIKLWSAPDTMSIDDYKLLQQFCENNRIILYNIREHSALTNYNLITKELDAAKDSIHHKRLHYVRASDLARIGILLQEGGVYTDTDSKMLAPFSDFIAKQGILLLLFGDQSQKKCFNFYRVYCSHYHYFFPQILFDFIASEPDHPLLKCAAQISQVDYATYDLSENKQWEYSHDSKTLKFGTIKLTGTSLKWALNFMHQIGAITFDEPTDLFFDAQTFIQPDYDKSWLEGFERIKGNKDLHLEAFIEEIHANRQKKFPTKNHGDHPDLRKVDADVMLNRKLAFMTREVDFSIKLLEQREIDFSTKLLEKDVLNYMSTKILPPVAINFEPYDLPKINFEIPKISLKINEFDVSLEKTSSLTSQEIYQTYKKNGGGLLASFSIFKRNSNRKPDDLINILRMRAQNSDDPESASRKTLCDLKIPF